MTLLVANLLFLAWAQWIDSPRDAGATDALAGLPRLQLVGEAGGGANSKPTSANVPPPAVEPAAEEVALRDPAPQPLAATPDPVPEQQASQQTCTSVGPFNDITGAARAAGLLAQRGFKLQQRAEEGETIEGYWVFVGVQSDDDVSKVVERLEKNGFTDAHIMKNFASTNRRISVGMFSTRDRAEKRAAAVKKMGLAPEVGERRFPGTIYWVDVTLASRDSKLPQEYLFADVGHAVKVEMQPCPVAKPAAEPGQDGDDGDMKTLPRTTVASAPKS